MSSANNKEIALRYMKLVEQGRIDDALALAADDARFWHPAMGETGKAEVRTALVQFAPLMKSFRTTIRSVTAEDERVAIEAEVEMDLTNGKRYQNRYTFLFVIRDGQIRSSHEYVDTKPFELAFT